MRIIRQELSCALCRGTAGIYDRSLVCVLQRSGRRETTTCSIIYCNSSLVSVVRGVGRDFMPGLERAVDEA